MARVHLQFYKTEFHYKGNTPPFYHELNLEALPKVGEKFNYQEWMFNLMESDAQKEFTERFNFQPGEYYVIGKTDYPGKDYQVDHSFYLIEQMDDRKSGFIDLNDKPEDY